MVSHEIGLCRELLGYFGLFLIQFCKEGKFSGKKERKNLGQPGDGEGRYGQVLSPGNAGVTARGLVTPQGNSLVCGPYYCPQQLDQKFRECRLRLCSG